MATRKKNSKKPSRAALAARQRLSERFNAEAQAYKRSKVRSIAVAREARRLAQEIGQTSIRAGESVLEDGGPLIASLYMAAHATIAEFAGHMLALPELAAFDRAIEATREEYMPSFPPMSPVTDSYFNCWATYDLALESGGDTLGDLAVTLLTEGGADEDRVTAATILAKSRPGIYQVQASEGELVTLLELVTATTATAINWAQCPAEPGALWLVRVLPPLGPEDRHSLIFGTPYVLKGFRREHWLDYMLRVLPSLPGSSMTERYHHLMKCGPGPRFWLEFIMDAYAGHIPNAVFLTGIPDLPETLPHSSSNPFDALFG